MPLTSKGNEIMNSMEKTYKSPEKAKQVFYASKNAGKISGVDAEYSEHTDALKKRRDYLKAQLAGVSGEQRRNIEAQIKDLDSQLSTYSKDASRGQLTVGAKDAMPTRFACDSLSRSALIVDRVGDFVLLEGMALDSGFYFTQGPGGPRKFSARQDALDYIEYAQDNNMFEGMDIEKASVSYVKPEPLTAAEKAAQRTGKGKDAFPSMADIERQKRQDPRFPKVSGEEIDMTDWLKKNPKAVPHVMKVMKPTSKGKDAELFPGSSKPDHARADLYRQVNKTQASRAAQEMRSGRPSPQTTMSRSDLEGMDVEDPRQRRLEEANSVLDDPSIAPERKAQAGKMISTKPRMPPPMKRGLMGTPAPDKKPGRDAESGIHMTDWLKEANQSPEEKEAALAKQRYATARNTPEPQIHMKDYLKEHGRY